MIEVVAGDDIVRAARASLGLPIDKPDLDDPYIASALRRLAGFTCPCSPRTLVRTMVDSHHGLVSDDQEFVERVEAAIETLIDIGDLLELGDVALEGDAVKGTWIVAAPPAFTVRPSGSVFILGLSSDEQTPLPTEIRDRIDHSRAIRSIPSTLQEDLPGALRDLGLRELSSATWLRSPKAAAPQNLLEGNKMKLSVQRPAGEIPDILLLDGARRTRSYRARWTKPTTQTGYYIARRPQAYGADLWGYAEFRDGVCLKYLDLPGSATRWRGCDAAWRIQMAIDAMAGRPQQYRLRVEAGGSQLDFFSPVPSWARRRLAIIGEERDPAACLMSFFIPAREVDAEKAFLSTMLFMTPTVD